MEEVLDQTVLVLLRFRYFVARKFEREEENTEEYSERRVYYRKED